MMPVSRSETMRTSSGNLMPQQVRMAMQPEGVPNGAINANLGAIQGAAIQVVVVESAATGTLSPVAVDAVVVTEQDGWRRGADYPAFQSSNELALWGGSRPGFHLPGLPGRDSGAGAQPQVTNRLYVFESGIANGDSHTIPEAGRCSSRATPLRQPEAQPSAAMTSGGA